MLELKSHNYSGKNEDELLSTSLNELNANTDEVYYDIKEEVTGSLFKSKKYHLTVVLKNDVIDYIKSYLKEITDLMGISCNFEIQKREEYIKVNIVSDSSSILIGKNGRTLDAIQTLVKNYVNLISNDKLIVSVDIGNYKEKRKHQLEILATKVAKEVAKTKIPVKLKPMSAFERRIIHTKLSDWRDVYTESEGEGEDRALVIKPKSKE